MFKSRNKIIFIGCWLCIIQFAIGQPDASVQTTSAFTIASKVLGEDRHCLISLPDSYFEDEHLDHHYPLIILLDGETFFKTTTGIVHFMSSSRNRNLLMPETIIVAIENVDRERDFTVTKIKTKRQNTMGGGQRFLSFIATELIPHIDNNYRTQSHRTLIGHSLGGLLTLNSYLDPNSIFDAFLAIDPSIWWDEAIMKQKATPIHNKIFDKSLYLATANQGQANIERNKKRHDDFVRLLKLNAKGAFKVKLSYFENEDHRSVPLVAIYEGLKYLNQE